MWCQQKSFLKRTIPVHSDEEYCSIFIENVEYVSFISSANRLKLLFQKWGKRKSGECLKYIETFHPIKYQKLSSNDKREHSLINCKSCAKYFSNVQATFEINLNPTKHSKNMDGAIKTSSSFKAKTLKENTQQIYNLANNRLRRNMELHLLKV